MTSHSPPEWVETASASMSQFARHQQRKAVSRSCAMIERFGAAQPTVRFAPLSGSLG
jgi:hypothetical protein